MLTTDQHTKLFIGMDSLRLFHFAVPSKGGPLPSTRACESSCR